MSNDAMKQPDAVLSAVRDRRKKIADAASMWREDQRERQIRANEAKAHADKAEADALALTEWLQQNSESVE